MEGLATPSQPPNEEAELFGWAAETCHGRVVCRTQTAGGNRCRSWALDVAGEDGRTAAVFLRYVPPRPPSVEPYTVHREAQVYRAIATAGIQAPRLIAEHPRLQAILTDRATGIAEFRRLSDQTTKQAIAGEFMANLARLHRTDVTGVALDGGVQGDRIVDHVRAELGIWRAMYEETGRRDALIELAFRWLEDAMPDPDGPVVLAHGDAGPGNFLFEQGHLTALIDWELAHLGDPMEDLAWFSMRCVMEPVPDFAASVRDYERFSGACVDRGRVLYHRVFVSARVAVIRHRNVTGEPAYALVSRALNRRLLVEALAEASGCRVEAPAPLDLPPTPRGELYDRVLADLSEIAGRGTDGQVVSKAKNAAKIVKYLQAIDRFGDALQEVDRTALAHLLHDAPTSANAANEALAGALREGHITFPNALAYFTGQAARDAQLAATASGGIAGRHYPALRP